MRFLDVVAMMAAGLAFAAPTTKLAHAERRLALIVGNDKYEHLATLQKAVADATAGASSETIVDVLLKKKAMIRLCLKNGHCGSMTVYMPSRSSLNYDYQYDGQVLNSLSLNFPGINILKEEDSAKVELNLRDANTILWVTNGSYRATLTKIDKNRCEYFAPIIKKG